VKPKRLGRGLKGLIKSSDPEALPPSRKTVPPPVQPVIPPPAAASPAPEAPSREAPLLDKAPDDVVVSGGAPRPASGRDREAAPDLEVIPPAEASSRIAAERGLKEPESADRPDVGAQSIRQIPVGEIRPNPYQPRLNFAADELAGLQASIAEHGVLQPVVVRPAAVGFELIAGERRLRAVRALEYGAVPAIVRRASDEEMQTLALVENLQRVDLNAIEKARSLKAMMRNFGLTQEEVAVKVGKARTSISNLVRLLELPAVIQDLVSEGQLSGSQARALLLAHGVERRLALARRAVRQGLTVRQIEKLAKAERSGLSEEREANPYVVDLETRLKESLGTTVRVKTRGKGGSIVIGYHDANELDRLLAALGAS